MYALTDGNNFYASSEMVFRPSLKGRPLVVLGNGDGCAIARSNEAKALGIKMGAPWFEIKHLEREAGLIALSANFPLYGDMSRRMMGIAAGMGPEQSIYSIDECFTLGLEGVRGDLARRARTVRERILQWTGLPTCIGIGQTPTLAKLANHVAKSAERKPGSYPAEFAQVLNLAALPSSDFDAIMQATEVGEVWGVGPRIGRQLVEIGITTVLDLVRMDPVVARRRWSVVLERTVRELQGQPCVTLDEAPPDKKQIAHTRSFGQPISTRAELEHAVIAFASAAAVKLRLQSGLAGQVLIFISTSPFRKVKQHSGSIVVPLRRPTADSAQIAHAAAAGLHRIWRQGFEFSKAGIMLLDLQRADAAMPAQGELDLEEEGGRDRSQLMRTMDTLNDRYGRGTIRLAGAGTERPGLAQPWQPRQERRTPHYTTDWNDLPIAR